MLNLTATSGSSQASRGNMKAPHCQKGSCAISGLWKDTIWFGSPSLSLVSIYISFNKVTPRTYMFAAFSFQILVSKELASNLSQSIPLFEHSKSPVHSMENAQLSFIDQRDWTNSVAFELHGCHSN